MDLWTVLLANYLSAEQAQIIFPNISIEPEKIVEGICYQTLLKIKQILENEGLDDAACFLKIEEILCTLEDLGCDCGTRHDF